MSLFMIGIAIVIAFTIGYKIGYNDCKNSLIKLK